MSKQRDAQKDNISPSVVLHTHKALCKLVTGPSPGTMLSIPMELCPSTGFAEARWLSLLFLAALSVPSLPKSLPATYGDNEGPQEGTGLIQCGEYSNQVLPNGRCKIVATLPQGDEQRCPDMFRCTDEVSYWLHENEERKQQILELRELEGDPALEAVPSPITPEIFCYDSHNYVRRNWSLLAPGQYEVDQRLTGSGDYEPRLDMLWYRLSLPCLASPLLDDLISWYSDLRYAPEHYTVTEPELPGFDRAVLVQDNRWPGQELFLQTGNVVIYLDYSGAQDLTGRPELLARLAAFEA